MIKDKRVSEIINEILKKEMNKTIEAIIQVEKLNKEITGRSLEMDYKKYGFIVSIYFTRIC